jgi:hypothetical protein
MFEPFLTVFLQTKLFEIPVCDISYLLLLLICLFQRRLTHHCFTIQYDNQNRLSKLGTNQYFLVDAKWWD